MEQRPVGGRAASVLPTRRMLVADCSFVKVYRRPYPHHRTPNSCSRTLIVWKQSLGTRYLELDTWKMERAKGFEPSTPTLARLCSTTELRPRHFNCIYRDLQTYKINLGRNILSLIAIFYNLNNCFANCILCLLRKIRVHWN